LNSHKAAHYSQDARGPVLEVAQYFPTAPILGPATHAENRGLPPEGYTGTTSGHLSVVLDPPAWPTLHFPHNNLPPWVPAFEYRPTKNRGLYINHLDPFSVESSRRAVGSSTHLDSGGLSNGYISEQPYAFNEANPRGRSEDVWGPVVRPPPGQEMSGYSSGGIGAQVGTHPPAHLPGHGIYAAHGICKSGEEVTFSNGNRNREE